MVTATVVINENNQVMISLVEVPDQLNDDEVVRRVKSRFASKNNLVVFGIKKKVDGLEMKDWPILWESEDDHLFVHGNRN